MVGKVYWTISIILSENNLIRARICVYLLRAFGSIFHCHIGWACQFPSSALSLCLLQGMAERFVKIYISGFWGPQFYSASRPIFVVKNNRLCCIQIWAGRLKNNCYSRALILLWSDYTNKVDEIGIRVYVPKIPNNLSHSVGGGAGQGFDFNIIWFNSGNNFGFFRFTKRGNAFIHNVIEIF